MTALFAGLGVSLELTSVCVVDEEGRMVRETKVAPEPDAITRELRSTPGRYVRTVAVNREGAVIQRAKFARDVLQSLFDFTPKALIGMEACSGLQWLARA